MFLVILQSYDSEKEVVVGGPDGVFDNKAYGYGYDVGNKRKAAGALDYASGEQCWVFEYTVLPTTWLEH